MEKIENASKVQQNESLGKKMKQVKIKVESTKTDYYERVILIPEDLDEDELIDYMSDEQLYSQYYENDENSIVSNKELKSYTDENWEFIN